MTRRNLLSLPFLAPLANRLGWSAEKPDYLTGLALSGKSMRGPVADGGFFIKSDRARLLLEAYRKTRAIQSGETQ